MITLKIKDIEEKTGRRIRQNAISIGFDTAPGLTGIAILKATADIITLEHIEIIATSAKDDHLHRADHYVNSLKKFIPIIEKYKDFKVMVIEQCWYGKNVNSLIQLAQFGIITYITLKNYFNEYFYIGATTARSLIRFNQKRQEAKTTLKAKVITKGKNKGTTKKISCKELVHDYLKTDLGVVIEQPDEADAMVLALAGLLS